MVYLHHGILNHGTMTLRYVKPCYYYTTVSIPWYHNTTVSRPWYYDTMVSKTMHCENFDVNEKEIKTLTMTMIKKIE